MKHSNKFKLMLSLTLALSLFISSPRVALASDIIPEETLAAQWRPNAVKISFNSNGGGIAPGDQIYTYGVERSLPGQCNMYKEGYTLAGWAETADATVPKWQPGATSNVAFGYSDATKAMAKTLYAVWKDESPPGLASVKFYDLWATQKRDWEDKYMIVVPTQGKIVYLNTYYATLSIDTFNISTNETKSVYSYYFTADGAYNGGGAVTYQDFVITENRYVNIKFQYYASSTYKYKYFKYDAVTDNVTVISSLPTNDDSVSTSGTLNINDNKYIIYPGGSYTRVSHLFVENSQTYKYINSVPKNIHTLFNYNNNLYGFGTFYDTYSHEYYCVVDFGIPLEE